MHKHRICSGTKGGNDLSTGLDRRANTPRMHKKFMRTEDKRSLVAGWFFNQSLFKFKPFKVCGLRSHTPTFFFSFRMIMAYAPHL